MPVAVTTRGLGRSAGLGRATVLRRAEAMLAALGLEGAELSILLCDDATIAELNAAYRHRRRPTDVLSFSMDTEAPVLPGVVVPMLPGRRVLGDVVVSLETAGRQAEERGESLRAEVTRLLAHGLLHLLGHVHDTKAALREMERETDRLVAAAEAVSRPRRSAG